MPHSNLAIRYNYHLDEIKPNNILTFNQEISSIPDIVKLTLGEPDFNVPEIGKQAAIASIENNDSHYAPGTGSEALRKAIADFLKVRYQLTYSPDQEIVVTIGATEAIYASLNALLNPGDKVLIPTPTFPLYETVVRMLGGVPINLDTSSNNFVLSPAMVKAALDEYGPAVKAVILNYPSNPTGVTYSASDLQALAEVLAQSKAVVIADEIYSELLYDGQHVSIATYLPEQTLVLNGDSKSHAMTGYRIGFIAGPTEIMQKVSLVHNLMITSPSDPAMAAAVPCFGTETGRQASVEMRAAYQIRRDYMVEELTNLGFTVAKPNGAFYIFAQIPHQYGSDDVQFARDLAQEAQVATIPGSFFGPGGEGYLRMSYATSLDDLKTAISRIQNFLN